ncbi:MAG: 4'-phosphopantetheinyl transferase superfamily protein [Pseudomonadota bacterium]
MIISAGEVHLWFAYDDTIKDAQLLVQYLSVLNEAERAQQQRFHFEKHRHQYLITRALARSVLSMYVKNIVPEQWEFEKNDYGKPFISNSALTIPIRFNLSHADELIVMAVTLDQEVGVDVEYLPRAGKMLDIASSFFSPAEVQQLLSLPLEKQMNRFYDLWTLKEAYIKACGMGLSIPLDHFSYSFSPQGKITIDFKPERNDQPEFWRFWQIQPNAIHKISLALKSENLNNTFSISMREVIPLSRVIDVNYSLASGSIISE